MSGSPLADDDKPEQTPTKEGTDMMAGIFNTVEELTGTYPTGENLRNAVHAIITQRVYSRGRERGRPFSSALIRDNVDYIARNYESARGTVQVLYVNGVATEEEYLRFPNNGGN